MANAKLGYDVETNHENVLEDVERDHEEMLRVFEWFKAAVGAARIKPFAQLKARVRQYVEAEEGVLFPLVTALGGSQAALVTTATTEHTTLKNAVTAIESAGAENASGGQVTTLENAIKNHFKAERTALYEAVRQGLNLSQSRELAERYQAKLKASLLS